MKLNAECFYAECRIFYFYAECCQVECYIFGRLSVAMLSVAFFIVMVSVDVMKV